MRSSRPPGMVGIDADGWGACGMRNPGARRCPSVELRIGPATACVIPNFVAWDRKMHTSSHSCVLLNAEETQVRRRKLQIASPGESGWRHRHPKSTAIAASHVCIRYASLQRPDPYLHLGWLCHVGACYYVCSSDVARFCVHVQD